MEETVFPPSPCWCLPNIMSAREDGRVSYGSKTAIVILDYKNKSQEMTLIRNAHTEKITAVAFAPPNCSESLQNTVVSGAGDGFVKLWKIDTLDIMICHKSHREPTGHIGGIVSLDWSTANPCHIVSAAENNTLVLWDVISNTTVRFSLQKGLGATVVSCCPHNEKMVAVGGKTGQVHIMSLTGSGHTIHKLRGHDNRIQSLSWCPIPFNVFNAEDIEEEFLVASACQNKEIFVWRAGTDGKCETKYQLPTNSLSKKENQYYGKLGNNFSYSAILWLEPYKIYTSSNFGELIYLDIKSFVRERVSEGKLRPRSSMSAFRLGHSLHMKGLFAIAGVVGKVEIVVYRNIDVKSKVKLVRELKVEVSEGVEGGCGAEGVWEAVAPERSLVWTTGQDRKVVGCEVRASRAEMVATYHTINNFVYCAVGSPHDPNKIAIGAGDGMIRLWNLTERTDLKIFWQKIRDRVMSLAWHPTKDGLLAYGTSEGRVGLVSTNSTKLPTVFKPSHPQPIYSLSWGPAFGSVDQPPSAGELDLYSIGNNILSVYSPSKLSDSPVNLSEVIPFPCRRQTDVCWKPDHSLMAVGNEDGSVCLVRASDFSIVCTVQLYKKFIESIAWHPRSTSVDTGLSPCHGYLTSGSTDNECEIRVFDCGRAEGAGAELVATLRGHFGHVAAVAWSPHVSGRLVSSSADGSVQVWDVIHQTPLANFVPSGMALFSIFSPVDSDIVLTGCKTETLHVWKVSGQTRVAPSQSAKGKKQVKERIVKLSKEVSEVEGERAVGALAEAAVVPKAGKEGKMFSKAWKAEAEEGLEVCYSLLKSEENREGEYSLAFLGSEEEFRESVAAEEESLRKSAGRTEWCELALWKGSIKEVVEERMRSGQLNEFLVSLAPFVSPRVWQEACLSYSRTLAEKKMHRRAASYLIVCHRIYEAIRLLADANLYLEALCIARSRLPRSDPVFRSVLGEYAQWLSKTGSFLRACQCYIYLEDYLEVAKICGKKSQAEYLSLAALAAKKCGSDLEPLEATNAIFKCFETGRFELAERICADHESLRHLGLFRCVYNTIHRLDVGALELEKDILSHIRESFECEDVLFPSCVPKLFHKYCLHSSKHQVLRILTEELSFAACARHSEEVLTHLIKALSTCSRLTQSSPDQDQLLYKLCVWLSPRGFLTGGDVFSSGSNPLVKSLRAFLCAAIVRHLSENAEELPQRLEMLKELKDDLLDPASYEYFRNLLEIEMCEKRLVNNQSKLSRRGLAGVREESEEAASAATNGGDAVGESRPLGEVRGENGEEGVKEDVPDEVVGARVKDLGAREEDLGAREGDVGAREGDVGAREGDVGARVKDLGAREEDAGDGSLKREVQKDLELLDRLKLETENFEKSRIIAPNPIPFRFMLKKLCLGLPENETAKSLLQDLDRNEHI